MDVWIATSINCKSYRIVILYDLAHRLLRYYDGLNAILEIGKQSVSKCVRGGI